MQLAIGIIIGILLGYWLHDFSLSRKVFHLDAIQRKRLQSWLDKKNKLKDG